MATKQPKTVKKHNMHFLLAKEKYEAVKKFAKSSDVTITAAFDQAVDLLIAKSAKGKKAAA
jgi:hypothetical protein